MASAPSDRGPVLGRVDRNGRLVAADPELAALQVDAGSRVGAELALPQVAAVARLARRLGVPVARPAVAASAEHDLQLWVRATPDGDEVALSIERWTELPPAAPRLAGLVPGDAEMGLANSAREWTADEDLRLVALSPELAAKLGIDFAEAAGQPLTRIFRLEENEAGEMPLLAALAGRSGFAGQRASTRAAEPVRLLLSGEPVRAADGRFAGYKGTAAPEGEAAADPTPAAAAGVIDQVLDEALRSPLDRIIASADRIAGRAEGPLRSDYAAYASDISAAARHLLSVIRSMGEEPGQAQEQVDLAALAGEAAGLIETSAEARHVTIEFDADGAFAARGESRGIIQILVNLIGNAVRHSPEGGVVTVSLERSNGTIRLDVADRGPGIDPGDQQRIFERFERAAGAEGGTGLGLAISRRLARSMGGDISVDSAPGAGACFTFSLPAA